jgi:ADP-ribosylglycohydrolase
MYTNTADRLESHAFACLAYGVIGDAMGTPTENLEPAEIEERFGWVESFEGDGTDDTIMRDLLAAALIRTRGFADADCSSCRGEASPWLSAARDRGGNHAEFEFGNGDRAGGNRKCR